MSPQEAIRATIDGCQMIVDMYLDDLTEAESLHRPAPGANHIRWQLGHLIDNERKFNELLSPGVAPALPAGFSDRYSPETAQIDDGTQFDTLATLRELARQQRAATLQILRDFPAEKLGEASGIEYAPRWVDILVIQGTHWLMHAGQWAVIRRQLGRPPLF